MLRSAAWLKSTLGTTDQPIVFDCRFSLQDPAAGRDQYLAGHIPGAWFLDMEHDLAGPKTAHSGRHPLPDVAELAAKLSAAGVSMDREVVVYDTNTGGAVRAWWLLRYLGHDRVSVLDGGWTAWLAAGGNVSVKLPFVQSRSSGFTPDVREGWVASVEEVEAISVGQALGLLIDARASERYRGDVEPIDAKAGHIPGAINTPWTDNLNEDGTWKSPEALRLRFEGLANTNQPVVAYCGSGVTACGNLFALELAGLRGAKLYPGSWSEWSRDSNHPVETGNRI